MRNLEDRVNDIREMLLETIKNCRRSFSIIEENLSTETFNQVSYGEAKMIEEKVNRFESQVEKEVVKTIARFQPVALNLRFLISVIKMGITFERINDLSINILKVMKHSESISSYKNGRISEMLSKVQNMFSLFSKSYFEENLSFAYLILSMDEEVNTFKYNIIKKLDKMETIEKKHIEELFIAQHLERIGDSIKNLAEMTVYIYNGVDIRHKLELIDSGMENEASSAEI